MNRVVVYDLADTDRRLTVERVHWRATLQLLYRDAVLGKDRLGRLDWRLGGAGTSITRDECIAVASYVAASLLPCFAEGRPVVVPNPGPAFDGVTDGTLRFTFAAFSDSPVPPSITLPHQWLQEFAAFLSTAGGIGALEEAFLADAGLA